MSFLVGAGVTKTFGGLLALDRLDFEIRQGEIVGLIGPNGAGKTTLINTVTGVYKPNKGSITFAGRELTRLGADSIAKLGIARTFQIPQPFATLSALDNVMASLVFGSRAASLDHAEEEARSILEFVGLAGKGELLPQSLNIVELRRLELARAVASGVRLLLLDEIHAGLTSGEIKDAVRLIERLRERGMTLVLVEHVMRIIMSVCERIIVLHFGKKIAEGTPAEIASDAQVIGAYLGERRLGRRADIAGR